MPLTPEVTELVITQIRSDVSDIKQLITSKYVTQDQLLTTVSRVTLLERLMFGFVSLVLSTVLLAVIGLVILRK